MPMSVRDTYQTAVIDASNPQGRVSSLEPELNAGLMLLVRVHGWRDALQFHPKAF